MTLREQILLELEEQNSKAQARLKELDNSISVRSYNRSKLSSGMLADLARQSCDKGIEEDEKKKSLIRQENAWISEMLSKYKYK